LTLPGKEASFRKNIEFMVKKGLPASAVRKELSDGGRLPAGVLTFARSVRNKLSGLPEPESFVEK